MKTTTKKTSNEGFSSKLHTLLMRITENIVNISGRFGSIIKKKNKKKTKLNENRTQAMCTLYTYPNQCLKSSQSIRHILR